MCVRTVNVDEARLRKISASFKDVNVIDQWLQIVINNAIDDMELGDLTELPVVAAENYPYDKDMTVEELYSAVMEDVKAIYAK